MSEGFFVSPLLHAPMPLRPPTPRTAALAALIAGAAFTLVVLAIILFIPQGERQAFDQNTFHYRAIARFAAALPFPSFADYESATTPGYHYLLAWVHRATGGNLTALRLAGALWGVALVALFAGTLARRAASTSRALILALPLASSLYILSASTGLLPDVAAWCCVAALFALALRPRTGAATLVLMGGLLLALVLIRQIHAWAGILLIAAAWRGTGRAESSGGAGHPSAAPLGAGGADVPSARSSLFPRILVALACGLPALLALAWFAKQWGGLVPPAFSAQGSPLTTHEYTRVSGLSPLTPGFILALIGGLSVFYVGFLWPVIRQASWRIPAALAALLGGLLAALPVSTWSLEAGRYSGLWNLVRRLPTLANRSSLIILAAALGGVGLVLWSKALPRRDRLILGAALAAFTLAHTAQALVWQRYSEPLLLIMLSLAAASLARPAGRAEFSGGADILSAQPSRVPSAQSPVPSDCRTLLSTHSCPRWAWLGPILLALINASITAAAFIADKNPAPALGVAVP